jgi:hypothetical protein
MYGPCARCIWVPVELVKCIYVCMYVCSVQVEAQACLPIATGRVRALPAFHPRLHWPVWSGPVSTIAYVGDAAFIDFLLIPLYRPLTPTICRV